MAKFYYNGILLPEMPSNAIAGGYQCQFIRKNTNSGYYDLVMSPQNWYYSDNAINPVYTKKNWWYRIEIATADEATAWTFKESTTSGFAISATAPILWSSHDVPNGSISATEMYIEGTEPIPEDEGEEKNYFYMIKTETLESFADEARRINGSTDLLTTEQMIEIFGEAKIPKLQDKTITENGTYQADSGYDGLGSVTVEVASSGSLEGLENGYDVTFYDENNDVLAFFSIKQGLSISPPDYPCNAWLTEKDGQEIIFPLKPSGDVSCYAFSQVYADQIYEAYGVDKNVYPYLAIRVGSDTTYLTLYFAKTLLESGTSVTLYSYGILVKEIKDLNLSESDLKDITRIVSIAISGVGGNFSTSSYDIKFSTAKALYTNFAHEVSCDVISARLD